MNHHTTKPAGGPVVMVFIIALMSMVTPLSLQAQYNTSLGIRIGGTSGITLKHFYRPTMAYEGILGGFGNGFSVTALLEKHLPIHDATGLYVYYGGGAHLAFYNDRNNPHFGREVGTRAGSDAGFGINGIVGIEYRLPDNIPLGISLDLKPFVEIGTGGYVAFAADPAIGIKFILN